MTAPLRLTPQERALVAEAIAAGRLTLCPPAIGTVTPAGMPPEARQRVSEIVLASPSHRRYRGAREAEVITRRRRVERLRAAGACRREIAATIGVCISTVDKDLQALRRRQG